MRNSAAQTAARKVRKLAVLKGAELRSRRNRHLRILDLLFRIRRCPLRSQPPEVSRKYGSQNRMAVQERIAFLGQQEVGSHMYVLPTA